MQKKRPRSKGTTRDGSGATPPEPGAHKRTVRVRSRLVAGVAVVGVIVIAAGAPAVLGASTDLTESQRLVTLAELNQQAVSLAHSLADERDAITAYIADGRDEKSDDSAGEEPQRPHHPGRPADRRDPRGCLRGPAPRPLDGSLTAP